MRDPKRISRIIKKLQTLWEKHPDMRLCQLISNVAFTQDKTGDLFYVEDTIIEQGIDAN